MQDTKVLARPVVAEDLYGDAYFHDPHPFWARMRQDQPIFHDTVFDSWILTRYADVEAVFKDFEHYSSTTYTHSTGAVQAAYGITSPDGSRPLCRERPRR